MPMSPWKLPSPLIVWPLRSIVVSSAPTTSPLPVQLRSLAGDSRPAFRLR